jgi:cobalt-zinc-cadmium efflux system outer membrane protein
MEDAQCRGVLRTLVVLLLSVSAAAQPLSLEDALARAEARSPILRVAAARIQQGAGRRTTAGYLTPANPRIDVSVVSDFAFAAQGERSIDIGLEQELEIFGQRGLRIDTADADLAALQKDGAATRAALRADVTVAYYDLMYQERRAALLHDIAAQADRLAEAGRRRLTAGDLPEAEVNLVLAERAAALAEAVQADADRVEAAARLDVIVGEPPSTAMATIGGFPAPLPAAATEELLARARARRPELAAARADVEARGAEVALRRRERLPNPTLFLGYTNQKSVFEPESFPPGLVSAPVSDVDQLLGFRLSFPIPLLRSGAGEIQEAAGRRAEAEARRDGLALSVHGEVTAAHARYERLREAAAAFAEVEPKLSATIEVYERAYTAGKIDLGQFLTIRDRVLRATLAALRARRDLAAAGALLERAAGGPITEVNR